MDNWLYYGSLIVVLIIAVQFFRGGHFVVAGVVLAIGGWIIYSHENNITMGDLRHDMVESIDEAAKSEYKNKKIETSIYDYNTSKVE
jgi:hypothetical protein